jgi:hypothetical protein
MKARRAGRLWQTFHSKEQSMMMKSLYGAIAAVLLASPVFAGGAGSTVNISTTTSTIYTNRITSVVVVGEGTYTYPDPHAAPLLSQPSLAIQTALDELGLPMGTTASPQGTMQVGTDETMVEVVMSNYNPVDNPDYVVGDPEDYFGWIAVGPEDVNVFVTQTTTEWTYYQMTAGIDEPCGAGFYSATGNSPCTPCPAGTFNDSLGQTSCTDCGPGTFELDQGSQACDACPGGQATPCNDNGVCSDGPTGTGTCTCNIGYTGFACENGPPTTTVTSTTSTTLSGPCSAVPLSGCVTATKAGFQISTKSDPAKNKMKWKLGGGSLPVGYADLGDPTMTTTWTLCVYDSTGGTPFLSTLIEVDPSSLWTGKDPKGWKYKDKAGTQLGITGMSLSAGVAGKTKAQVKGAGSSLPLPVPVDTVEYFEQGTTVTVQLVKEGGAGADLCWTSEFDAADTKLNTPAGFKATAK